MKLRTYKYRFSADKTEVEMLVGDSFTVNAVDRRQAYRLAIKKMGLRAKLHKEAPVQEDKNQMKLFDEESF